MSKPFSGERFTFHQPDGSLLYVRGWGDQHRAVFEALNGYTVTRDPVTGYFEYADVSTDGERLVPSGARPRLASPTAAGLQPGVRVSPEAARAEAFDGAGLLPDTTRWAERRRERRRAMRVASAAPDLLPAPPKRTTVGDYVGLCLLVDFPDVAETIPRDEVERFCNLAGYTGHGNNGSVRDYFSDVSGGRLRYTNVVTRYYTAKHPKSYYTNPLVSYPSRARELVREALDDLKSSGFDASSLTVDGEGYVYALNVFYAGALENNWSEGLWPHAYRLLTPFELAPGKKIYDYQITDMSDELSLGTFCHENGHMICDFPDLYDYGDESAGIGGFCLMCAGGNLDSKNPGDVGAYLKMHAGWDQGLSTLSPGVNLQAVAGSNRLWIHRKDLTEYFLVENRQQVGRDRSLPAAGLAVWHVDELGDNEHEQGTPDLHYECSLIQADGRRDLETDRHNHGDAGDLYHAGTNTGFGSATHPIANWWDGTPSGLEIYDIGVSGPTMTFSVR